MHHIARDSGSGSGPDMSAQLHCVLSLKDPTTAGNKAVVVVAAVDSQSLQRDSGCSDRSLMTERKGLQSPGRYLPVEGHSDSQCYGRPWA